MESKYAGLEATAELVTQLKAITGDKELLNTTDKSTLVAAVNELYNAIFDTIPVYTEWNEAPFSSPSIAVNPVFADGTIIAVAAGSETYKCTIKYSKNNGATWHDSNYINGGWLANIIYIGNNILVAMPGINNYGTPIYSTDGGVTWQNSTLNSGSAYRNNYIHKFDNGNIISFSAATTNGIILSTDNGVSWQSTSAPAGKVKSTQYAIENNMMCVRMTSSEGYSIKSVYTTDGGATWTDMGVYANSPLIVNQTIYAVVGAAANSVQYTSDYGATWNTSSGAPTNADRILYNSVYDTFVILTTGYKVYYSTDGCATFQESTRPSSGYDITYGIGEYVILSNGTILFGRTSGVDPVYTSCVYSTDGGATWLSADSAYASAFVELLDGTVLVLSKSSSYDSRYFSIDNITAFWYSINNKQRILYAVTDKGVVLTGNDQTPVTNEIETKPKWETAIEALAAQLNA